MAAVGHPVGPDMARRETGTGKGCRPDQAIAIHRGVIGNFIAVPRAVSASARSSTPASSNGGGVGDLVYPRKTQ